jgi:hypothetical protein
MNRNQKIDALGAYGEYVVFKEFKRRSIKAIQSTDKYDSEKDGLLESELKDGTLEKIEVKTMVPFIMKDAFTIRFKQYTKCHNAAWVYFVSVPNVKYKHHSDGNIYRLPGKYISKDDFYITKDGRDMILIPSKHPKMEYVARISDKDIQELQKLSVSGYNP